MSIRLLPDAGPPPESECEHCGCRVIDYGNGWEYVEQKNEEWVVRSSCLPGRERECDDAPGGIIYHTVGGRERA